MTSGLLILLLMQIEYGVLFISLSLLLPSLYVTVETGIVLLYRVIPLVDMLINGAISDTCLGDTLCTNWMLPCNLVKKM
jgi:hypothetical protein